MPDMETWQTEIVPGVFIPVIILIIVIDIPLAVGILVTKKGRGHIANIAVVNFIFVSFLAVGYMSSNLLYSFEHFNKGTLPWNCDVIGIAYNTYITAAITVSFTILFCKLVEMFYASYTNNKGNSKSPGRIPFKPSCHTCTLVTLCVFLPWIYAVTLAVSVVDYNNNDMHDCYQNVTYAKVKVHDATAYFLPWGLTVFTMVLCILLALCGFRSRSTDIIPVWPYIGAVFCFLALSSADMFYYALTCYDSTDEGWNGCTLTAEQHTDVGQPLKILQCSSYLLFTLPLLLSSDFRRFYKNGICLPVRLCRNEKKDTRKYRTQEADNQPEVYYIKRSSVERHHGPHSLQKVVIKK